MDTGAKGSGGLDALFDIFLKKRKHVFSPTEFQE